MSSQTDEELLACLFEQAPIGLVVYDTRLRLVRVSAAVERVSGVPITRLLGRHVREVYPGSDGEVVEERLRSVLADGVPRRTEHRIPTPADAGGERVWSGTTFRMTGASGEVIGVGSILVDKTSRTRARERLTLLKEAGERIGSTLDVRRAAEEFAEVAVPQLADFVAVDLLDGVERGEEPSPAGGAPALRRAAVRSATPQAPQSLHPVGAAVAFHPATPLARCLASGEALLIKGTAGALDWPAHDPARAERITEAGVHSVVIVPLKTRDLTLGLVHFYRWRASRPFEDDDLKLAQELAARAAVCVDNARRYTRERRAALALQDSVLQEPAPAHGSLATAHRYLPARTGAGGDWFDVIALPGARTALVVGDVPGCGIDAVARAGRLRTAVRTLAGMGLSPDEVLAHLDDTVSGAAEPEHDAREPLAAIGATCLFAIYDPVTGHCQMASAGHLPPAVARPGRPAAFADIPTGPPLGLGGLPFETADIDLEADSILALFTNGLVQQRPFDLDAGLDRLRLALAEAADDLEELADTTVDATLAASSPDDDAVLLLARTRVLTADDVATWDLPSDPAVVSQARAMANRQLREWDLTELALVTELVVSELVTNAIRYGRSPIQLRLIRDRVLTCEVSDGSSTSPHLRLARDTDEGGRGLFMIAQLVDAWGTRYGPTDKTIWAEQTIRPAELSSLGEALMAAVEPL
ncbi:SpoIIE family protein phosphatase [Kitasatospora sp. NPDC048298]|uniref:SpoIIE family protein phosphatase n=1 Tax=Kitasatospora sp. NPDC048298 TaxID=3364049 RepID=UPI00371651F6